jgi:hypothetical protein
MTTRSRLLFPIAALTFVPVFTACDDDTAADDAPAPGTVSVSVYGEEYIEDALPASVFSDGWTVTFDEFLISLGAVHVAPEGADAGFAAPAYRVYDVARSTGGAGQVVGSGASPGAAHLEVEYTIAPAADAVAADGTTTEQLDRVRNAGHALFVRGRAVKGDVTKTFAWGFDTRTVYAPCHAAGAVDGGSTPVQLTIHGDHLFYDDLFSETPNVSFDLVAASDADGDGEITRAELLATDLSTQARYQVGSEPIGDLWHFVEFLTATVGHIDGEGHCDTTRE